MLTEPAKKRLWILALAVFVVALAVLACGGDSPPSQEEASTETPTETTEDSSTVEATETTALEWEGVHIGMPADDVLKIHPKSESTAAPVVLGEDSEGLVVRWSYPGAYLILAVREGVGTDGLGMSKCYRVIEIQIR